MPGLPAKFENVEAAGTDGFGALYRASCSGEPRLVRVVRGELSLTDAARRQLAAPPHGAILEVETGVCTDGVWLSAELPANLRSVASLLEAAPGGALSPYGATDLGLVLAEAAAAAESHGGPGPLTWRNVYVDPEDPARTRVFPLWPLPGRSIDWLAHDPATLLFLDRHTLRGVPASTSAVFSIGRLLSAVCGGTSSWPTKTSARQLIRSAIVDGDPEAGARSVGGEMAPVIARALGGALRLEGATDLRDEILAIRSIADPVKRALTLAGDGNELEALAVLHRAFKEGQRSIRLFRLKARLEVSQGHPARARRTLLQARDVAPHSREVLLDLASVAATAPEQVAALRSAVITDPLDIDLRLLLMGAEQAALSDGSYLRTMDLVQTMARVDPGAGRVWLAVAAALLRAGAARAALEMLATRLDTSTDPALRAAGAGLAGQALYAAGAFEEALPKLEVAVELASPNDPDTVELLNLLAFTYSARGRTAAAKATAQRSLLLKPDQSKIHQFVRALGRG